MKNFSRAPKLLMIYLRVQVFLNSTKVSGTAAEAESICKPFPVGQGYQAFIAHNIFLTSGKKALIHLDETRRGESDLHRAKG